MKSNNTIFSRIHNSIIIFVIIAMFFLKIILYISIKIDFIGIALGGGSDANLYNAYAIGAVNLAPNIWPVILRYLHNLGLYSREIVSYLLFFLNIAIIPFLTANIAGLSLQNHQKYYFYIFLLCLAYPTLFFYSIDVYRDIFMVFSFLTGCVIVKKCLSSSNALIFSFLFAFSILIGFLLLGLRPYLGYAFLLSLLLWKVKFTKKRIIVLSIMYLLVLFLANYVGLLDELTDYRSGFEESEGGSTLGLNFSNPVMFIPNFLLSILGQMFGLYITNPLSIMLLLIETLPFFFMLVYVIKNIRLADSFIRFLIIFFMIYGSIWLIGNDNLGTAVRLRVYNYLAIYISFFYILRLKKLYSATSEVVSK